MASKKFLSWFIATNTALLAACAATPQPGLPGEQQRASTPVPAESEAAQPQPGTTPAREGEQPGTTPVPQGEQPGQKFEEPLLHRGTGVFINTKPVFRGQPVKDTKGGITLNFDGVDIQDVIKTILGDVLHENYVIDPAVKGTVSVETSRAVSRADLMPILETLLQMNKATVVKEGALYRVVPLTGVVRGSLPAQVTMEPGERVQIVPLQYISAKEMEKILTPFVPEGSVIRADPARNLLILAGSGRELQHWLETVAIFDVDWLQGMSVGIFPVKNTEAKTLSAELDKLFLAQLQGGVAEMIRLVPIDRLNAVLAVTSQPAYLDQVKTWVERLDVVGREPGMRLFVYHVKNRKAAELAAVLNSVFGGTQQTIPRTTLAPVSLAPGLKPVEIKSLPTGPTQSSGSSQSASTAVGSSNLGPAPGGVEELANATGGAIRIIADEANNALIVMATAQSYQLVEAALHKLDIMPRQVLVEASIIEVSLTDDLRYGLQWFFKTGSQHGIPGGGKGVLSSGTSDVLSTGPFPAFSYAYVDTAGQIRYVFNTLASDSKIDVLSNPTLVVLDNQTAAIKVGDQVPVRTSESTSVSTSGVAPIITSTIEFRDTGVLLTVKPQVNPGGLVTLQITQQVNDVKRTESSGIDSPTIAQREISTVVAVQSGETVILGGLIKEHKTNSNSGIPGLRKIPLLGVLFGETKKFSERTELVVLITPRVINNPEDARDLADEFRKKMKGLAPTKDPKSEKLGQATPQATPQASTPQASTPQASTPQATP